MYASTIDRKSVKTEDVSMHNVLKAYYWSATRYAHVCIYMHIYIYIYMYMSMKERESVEA